MAVPRNLRSMYIHAYQSYLWNCAASHRLDTHGAQAVVAGDLVLSRSASRGGAPAGDGGELAAENESGGGGGGDGDADAVDGRGASLQDPHVVTAEEAAAGKYCIDDVVLPLPGSQVRYPENDSAQASACHRARCSLHGLACRGPRLRSCQSAPGCQSCLPAARVPR